MLKSLGYLCNISGKFDPKTVELVVTTYQMRSEDVSWTSQLYSAIGGCFLDAPAEFGIHARSAHLWDGLQQIYRR
ncbi:hypothetical protein P8452_66298 [Trifolium repens]|nr:hypothetical protein P8452_66298 [Trifolium repens]